MLPSKTPPDKRAIQRQTDATDKQINQLVYELYGLTDEGIRDRVAAISGEEESETGGHEEGKVEGQEKTEEELRSRAGISSTDSSRNEPV